VDGLGPHDTAVVAVQEPDQPDLVVTAGGDDVLRSHGLSRQTEATIAPPKQVPEIDASLLRELVAHLRQTREHLREEWVRRITDAQLLSAMSPDEIFSEVTAVYDNYRRLRQLR
jgi:hypothetical protein